jgi:hypothetical protein
MGQEHQIFFGSRLVIRAGAARWISRHVKSYYLQRDIQPLIFRALVSLAEKVEAPMSRATESTIALAVLQLADRQPNGVASFRRIYTDLPNLVNLDSGDYAPSQTRNGEPMWRQIVRNIRSHHGVEGNYIQRGFLEHVKNVGYRITDKGRAYLRS